MKKQNKKILITGGAGYIGTNLVSFLLKRKYNIDVIDNLSTSSPINKNIIKKIKFYNIDLTKESKVKFFFKNKNFDLIVHLAAFSGVEEFNKNILKSFNNNVLSTKNLINYAFNKKNTKLIFASSAAVYGETPKGRINESYICKPLNYYGLSKLACENIIKRGLKRKKNNYAILRYFNVVGTVSSFKVKKKINSLFDIIGNNVKKKTYKININGKNLNTIDGTPERDFIHIHDLCRIHQRIFSHLSKNNRTIINCGSGKSYSVSKIISSFEKKINKKFKITYKVTNSNETQTICANNDLLKSLLKIKMHKSKINDFVKDYLY